MRGVSPTSGEEKFSFRGRGIGEIATGIFGCHVETVERIVACKCSSPWKKEQDLCLLYGEILETKVEILYNPGQVTVFLLRLNALFSSAFPCTLIAPQRKTFIGEHFNYLLFCQLFHSLQVMQNTAVGVCVLAGRYLSVQHRCSR